MLQLEPVFQLPPAGPTQKMVGLPAAAARFSNPAKTPFPTGPLSVSMPAPPSRVTGIEMVPMEKESLPAPLVMARLVTSASGRLVVLPSTVTEMFVASAVTEIV